VPARAARPSWNPLISLAFALAGAPAACAPHLDVGQWKCATSTGKPEDADAGATPVTDAIAVPWSTGFEDGFCDYAAARGFCYSNTNATYELVTSPVHSGKRAAAFSVSAEDPNGRQARCVREGTLPTEAYYGAWFYIPATATNSDNWNLMFFEGGDPENPTKLWDVSLGNAAGGSLYLYVYEQTPGIIHPANGMPAVPIGSWFFVEFYWKQATDGSGQVALEQDHVRVLDVPVSAAAVGWARWHVGDLADALVPPDSTVYVDDISIRAP